MPKQIRPMGDIMLDLEVVIQEMIDDHDVQWGEVLHLVYGYLKVHYPGAREEYTDGSGSPVFFYGYLTDEQRRKLKL